MQSFKDQIVVITGASSGIGRELARVFSRDGATVVLAARSVDALEQLAAELREAGGQALVVPTDVRDYDQIERRKPLAASMSWSTMPARAWACGPKT